MNETYTLGGKEFRAITNLTIENRIHAEQVMSRMGIVDLVLEPFETPDQFAHRMWKHVRNSPELYNLIGIVLVPVEISDTDWTPGLCKETSEFVRKLTDIADYQTVTDITMNLFIGFFTSGAGSLTIFRKLSPTEPAPQTNLTAALASSVDGADSYGRSRTTTRTGIGRFFAGLFGRRSSRTSNA